MKRDMTGPTGDPALAMRIPFGTLARAASPVQTGVLLHLALVGGRCVKESA